MVKKNSKISLFVLTECRNVADTRTPRDRMGRACIESRGKNGWSINRILARYRDAGTASRKNHQA